MFYRLRQWYHAANFKYRTRIFSSPPITCQPDADCAIHTMLSQRDLPLYLAAIKSFLRWYPNVAVVVHSDGTLQTRDATTVSRHVPGCKVVTAAEADARACAMLGRDSFLFECRSWDPCYRRLLDTELWNSTPKRIIMDSDILVLRSPDDVIEWIERGQTPFLIGQPAATTSATGRKNVQAIFREKVGTISQRLGLPNRFPQGATAGFYGCLGSELSLPELERIIRVCLDLDIPMREWGSDQCIVIYLIAAAEAIRLDADRYLNFDFDQVDKVKNAHVVHFLGYCRYYKDLYPSLAAEVIAELTRRSTVMI